jgi:hypothetical protein
MGLCGLEEEEDIGIRSLFNNIFAALHGGFVGLRKRKRY